MAGQSVNVGSTAVAHLINSTDIPPPSLTASMLQRSLPVQPTSSPPGGAVGPPPAAVIAAAMPFPLPVRIPFPPGPPPLPPNVGSTLSLAPPPSLQRQHCYLCDLPRAPWALLQLDYSEPVCRGCVNYEGADRVESAIESARRLKQALGGFGSINSDRPPSSSQCRLPPPHAVGGSHRPADDLQTRFPTVRAGLHSDVRPPVMRQVPSDIGLVQQSPQHRRDNVGAPPGGIMAARSHYQNGQLRSAHLSSTSHSSDCTIRTQPTAILPGTSTNGVLSSSSSSSSSSAALSSSSKMPSTLPPPSRFSIPGFSALDVSNPLPLALIRGEISSSIQNGNRSSVAQRGLELSGQMVSPTVVAAGPLQLTASASDSVGNSETAGGAAGYDRSSPTLSTTRSRIIVETLATLACSTPFDVRLKMEPAVVGRVLAFDANRPGSDQDPLQLAMYVELPSGTGMIYGCCGVGGLEPSGNNNNIKRTSSTSTSSNSGTDLSSDDLTSSSAPFRLLEYLHRSAADEWRPLQELLTDAVRQFREPVNRARLPSVSNNRTFIPPPSSGSTLGSSSAVLQQQIDVAMASLGGVGGYRGWNAMAAAAAAAAACGAVLPILPFTASGRSTTASVGLQQPGGHQLLQMYGTTSGPSATTTSALGSVGGRKRKAAELSPTSGNNSSDDSSAFVSSLPTSGFGLANTDSVQSIKRRLWMQSQADALRLALAFPAAALQAAVAQSGFVSPAAAAAALAGGVPLPNTFQRSASLSPTAIADGAANRRLHRKSGDVSDCDRRLRLLSNRSPTRRGLDDNSDVEQEMSDNSPADGEDQDINRGGGRSPPAGRTSDTNELQNVRPVTSPRCRLCDSRLEDTHFVQCPSVPAHKFCFPCSRDSIRRQQTAAANRCLMARRRTAAAAAKLPHANGLDSVDGNASGGDNEGSSPGVDDVDDVVNDDDSSEQFGATAAAVPEVYCPSGERCPLIQDAPGAPPWAFMANEIETILGSVTAPSFRQSSSVDSSRRSSLTPVVPAVVPSDEREINASDSREGSIDEGNDGLPASTHHRRQTVDGHHQQLQQQHQRQLQQPRTVKDVPQNRSESWSAALPTASLVQGDNGSTKTASRPTSGNGSIKRERDSA